MSSYLLGLFTIPAVVIASFLFGLLWRSIRDTWRQLHNAELKDGYSRWNWLLIIPRCFWGNLKAQLLAWCDGYSREVVD